MIIDILKKELLTSTTKNACGNDSVSMQGFSKQDNTKEWIRVPCKNYTVKPNKNDKCESTSPDQLIMTTNQFTPLSNLQANDADSSGLEEQKKRISTQDMNRTTKQHRIDMKIPTIVGGRLTHSDNRKLTPAKKETAHVPGAILNNKEHIVKILGGSYLRGTGTKIDHYLNTKFEVCSWINSGANTEELVNTLEKDLKCLGKKDVIVINGGANDIGSKRNQTNKVLVKMAQYTQKHSNSNIIVVNIPHRYDMDRKSVTNLEIQAVNRKLKKMAKVFSHVAIVDTDLNRKYFTRHGTHLNKRGKEWLSKLIVTQICRLVKSNNKDVPVIPLNWKDEFTDKQNTVNSLSEKKNTNPVSLSWNKPDGSVSEDKSLN